MSPAQEALAQAYADGERDGRDAAARESAAEIEGLRADLKEARAQGARWDAMARALRALLAQNPTVEFKPGPGPARLILGHYGLQGLGMDELLRALSVVAEECKPCLSKT